MSFHPDPSRSTLSFISPVHNQALQNTAFSGPSPELGASQEEHAKKRKKNIRLPTEASAERREMPGALKQEFETRRRSGVCFQSADGRCVHWEMAATRC